MKKLGLFLCLALSTSAFSGEIVCTGKVTIVMDLSTACGGATPFQLTNTNGAWICPPTEKGSAIVLAALMAGNEMRVSIDNNGGAFWCEADPNGPYPTSGVALPNNIVAKNIQIVANN